MIAAIRVRFTPTPPSAMWSDAVFASWLNSTVPYSLAHYWFKSSFTLADLKFQIFPPIVIDDPRLALTPAEMQNNGIVRPRLVAGVTTKVTEQFHPDWSTIDGLLIWFAQPTDLFGGGAFPVPLPPPGGVVGWLADFVGVKSHNKYLPVALSDIASSFHSVCQELGHAYGFQHPLDKAFEEYGDPYDAMAAEVYGGVYNPAFLRPVDPALPVGVGDEGSDVQRAIGPYLSAAHQTIGPFAATLKAAGMFIDVPPSYAAGASSFTLHALDDAIAHYPAQKLPIVAVIPPDTPGGDTYFLELRRAEGYDAGLRMNAADATRPPIGVVIHSYDKTRQRIVYQDTLPLADNRGDRDYHLFGGGGFTFRVTSIGADYKTVGITIGGREFWRHFGLHIEEVRHDELGTTQTAWTRASVSPCFMFGAGDYYYHYEYTLNRYTLIVSSFGYEKPGYVWTVNGTVLDPALKAAKVSATVESPGPGGKTVATTPVPIEYTVGPDRLSIGCDPAVGNFSLLIEVTSAETSPSVLKNSYEDRTVVTSVRFANVVLEWDDAYQQRQKECEEALEGVNHKHIPQRRVGPPKPDDRFRGIRVDQVIDELVVIDRQVTTALFDTAARVADAVRGIAQRR